MPRGRIGYVPKHKRRIHDRTPLGFVKQPATQAEQRAEELAGVVLDGVDGRNGTNGLSGFAGGDGRNGADGADAELSSEQKAVLSDGLRTAVVKERYLDPGETGLAAVWDPIRLVEHVVPATNYLDSRLLPEDAVVWASVHGRPELDDYFDGSTPLPIVGRFQPVASARELETVNPTYGLFYDADNRYGAGADTVLGIHREALLYPNGRASGEARYYLGAVRAPDGVGPASVDCSFITQSFNIDVATHDVSTDIATFFEVDGYLFVTGEGWLRRAATAAGPWELVAGAVGSGYQVSRGYLAGGKVWFVCLDQNTFTRPDQSVGYFWQLRFVGVDPVTGSHTTVTPANQGYTELGLSGWNAGPDRAGARIDGVYTSGGHLWVRAYFFYTSDSQTVAFDPTLLTLLAPRTLTTAGAYGVLPDGRLLAAKPFDNTKMLLVHPVSGELTEVPALVAGIPLEASLSAVTADSRLLAKAGLVLATVDPLGQLAAPWAACLPDGTAGDTTGLLVNASRIVSASPLGSGVAMVGVVEDGFNPFNNGVDPNRYFAAFVRV